jgi:hypothetical protein
MSREGRWDEMTAVISDEIFDTLIPCGTYSEIGATLRTWYVGVVDAITLRMPDAVSHDAALADVIAQLTGA